MSNATNKIYVAGHQGMVGSSIVRALKKQGFQDNFILKSHSELDLTNQREVKDFFANEKPNQVYLAAAKVGGINANNSYPADFIYQNLMIQSNIIHSAYVSGVKKLLFLGSSCIYPKLSDQPIEEKSLLTGSLESTNEPYAIAKIAGIKLCESFNRQYGVDYRSLMPCNIYGVGDNYVEGNSHVVPALIRRFHMAKTNNENQVIVWGSGKPRREFLFVDDLALASIYIMNLENTKYNNATEIMKSHINVGSGIDFTIKELAKKIAFVTGYKGDIIFDKTKLDGVEKKLLNSNVIKNLGWKVSVNIDDGLKIAFNDYINNIEKLRK